MKGIHIDLFIYFWETGIHIELAPSLSTNEFRLNIPAEEERHKSNGVKISGSGMLLSKLSSLEFLASKF